MKKSATALVSAALVAGAFVGQPATAHEIDVKILGAQYSFLMAEVPPDAGHTGYLGTPAGPVAIGEGASAEGVQTVQNLDAVPHTFTQCAEGCDGGSPTPGELFDYEVGPNSSVDTDIPVGAHIVMCRVHPWMRAAITVS